MLNSIQILRAIAALLVVFAHFEFVKPAVGGFGVDIFFVISGFIMAYIVDKNADAFLYRRIIRIVPLYFSMTLLTVTIFLFKPTWFRNVILSPEAILKSLLFIPYRIKGSGPILSLGWTLNYEMFFYLMIAISISLFGRKRGMTACLILLSVFVFIFNIYPPTNYALVFYSGSIILEFVAGSLLFYYWRWQQRNVAPPVARSIGIALGVFSFIFLIVADHLCDPRTERFLLFGIPCLFLANTFLILEEKVNPSNKLYSTAILLGDSSYAMYLVHPFVIYAFIRIVFARFKIENAVFELLELFLTMIIVCIVSVVIHKWFEKPVMEKLKKTQNKKFDREKAVNTIQALR